MNTRLEIRPSWTTAAFEAIAVGVLILLSFVVIGFFKSAPLWFSLSFGLVFGVISFAFYFAMFIWKAPTVIRLIDDDLSIEYLSKKDYVSLEEVREAYHEDSFGLRWRFEIGSTSVVLQDLGVSANDWDKLSRVLYERLHSLNKTVVTEGFATAFEEESSEIQQKNNNERV